MIEVRKITKEVRSTIVAFLLIAMSAIVLLLFIFYQISVMHTIEKDIYKHSFKVSNTVLEVKSDILTIHRDLMDTFLSPSQENLADFTQNIDKYEQNVYENLVIIEKNILENDGKKLAQETKELFQEWKPIRDKIVDFVNKSDIAKAKTLSKTNGLKHLLKLETSLSKLYEYAQIRAIDFQNNSNKHYEKLEARKFLIIVLFLLLLILIASYTIQRISNYMRENEHLKNLLSVIREINQLIVREKNREKLIQKSCDILASKHVFGRAWIALTPKHKQIEYIAGTDIEDKFTQFKEKIKSGWTPYCIEKTVEQKSYYSFTKDTVHHCVECPLKDTYDGKSALNFELKYDENIFGYLTLSIDEKNVKFTQELELLKEVTGDIAYALNSIERENSIDYLEESLSESEKHFKQLMKESPSVIEVYDLDGLQIDVNHAYEVLWGFDAGFTLNKFNLFKSEEVKRTGLLRYINRAYAGESVSVPLYEFNSTGDTEAQGKGRVRILNTRIYPLKDSSGKVKNIVITHEDVTERENSLLQLKQKKKELETIIQEAPNPIMIHDEEGKVVMINRVWEELTGYSYKEIDTVDKWLKKAYGKKMPQVKKYIEKLFLMDRKVNNVGEYSITTKNGDTVIWQFSTSPLGVMDEKRVMIASAMDITELKKKDKLMMVQSRHAAMGEMIGMIAHQWRQPISIVSMIANNMLLDMALGNFNSDKAENYSKDILEQTEHLSKTIDDFRNFFKPDKSVSKIRIKTIIDETYSIVKDSLINNNIEFKISNKSESEIIAYPRELMQAFVNIINNAKDALLLKEIKDAIIEVAIYEDENYVNTKICNNGGNIQEDIVLKIFDPYFTTKDEKTGTGLGLYMSKMIVEEHLSGIIEVSNIENDGVCFIVRLPKHRGVE